jgi:hypothetical protein
MAAVTCDVAEAAASIERLIKSSQHSTLTTYSIWGMGTCRRPSGSRRSPLLGHWQQCEFRWDQFDHCCGKSILKLDPNLFFSSAVNTYTNNSVLYTLSGLQACPLTLAYGNGNIYTYGSEAGTIKRRHKYFGREEYDKRHTRRRGRIWQDRGRRAWSLVLFVLVREK